MDCLTDDIPESVSLPRQIGRLEEPRIVLDGNQSSGIITLPWGGRGVYTVMSAEAAWELRSFLSCGVGLVPVEGLTGIACSSDPRAGMA